MYVSRKKIFLWAVEVIFWKNMFFWDLISPRFLSASVAVSAQRRPKTTYSKSFVSGCKKMRRSNPSSTPKIRYLVVCITHQGPFFSQSVRIWGNKSFWVCILWSSFERCWNKINPSNKKKHTSKKHVFLKNHLHCPQKIFFSRKVHFLMFKNVF